MSPQERVSCKCKPFVVQSIQPAHYAVIMRETKYDSADDSIFRLHPIPLYQLCYLTLTLPVSTLYIKLCRYLKGFFIITIHQVKTPLLCGVFTGYLCAVWVGGAGDAGGCGGEREGRYGYLHNLSPPAPTPLICTSPKRCILWPGATFNTIPAGQLSAE